MSIKSSPFRNSGKYPKSSSRHALIYQLEDNKVDHFGPSQCWSVWFCGECSLLQSSQMLSHHHLLLALHPRSHCLRSLDRIRVRDVFSPQPTAYHTLFWSWTHLSLLKELGPIKPISSDSSLRTQIADKPLSLCSIYAPAPPSCAPPSGAPPSCAPPSMDSCILMRLQCLASAAQLRDTNEDFTTFSSQLLFARQLCSHGHGPCVVFPSFSPPHALSPEKSLCFKLAGKIGLVLSSIGPSA